MDSRQFDSLTRFLARRITRRSAVRGGGAACLTAAMGAAALHPASAQDATPAATPELEHASLLFVQVATGGTFVEKPDTPGRYVLTLTGVGSQAIQFSDRPARVAGTLETAKLVDQSLFNLNDPPNAALVADTDAGLDILVIALYAPHYDAAAQTVTYEATVLKDNQKGWMAPFGRAQQDDAMAETLHAASLFIDSETIDCIPGGAMCFPINSNDGCCPGLYCGFGVFGAPQCRN